MTIPQRSEDFKPRPEASLRLPRISKAELLGAIQAGVHGAVWDMITNATSMPTADFFDAVEAGVEAGIARVQGGRK